MCLTSSLKGKHRPQGPFPRPSKRKRRQHTQLSAERRATLSVVKAWGVEVEAQLSQHVDKGPPTPVP